MQELERNGLCASVPGGNVHSCQTAAEWHWVRQVPPQAPAGAFPETPTDLYEAQGRPWQASRTGMFALEPHECDAEYMADSQELKMCRLERVPGAAQPPPPSPSPWMRTSEWYAETFHVLHKLGISHEPGSPSAEQQLHEKLRFLGLRKGDYQHATAETPAVLNCRAIGLCGIETVRVAGVKHPQRLLNSGEPHAFEDNKVCGAMGVRAGVGLCSLDPRTTVLYDLVRNKDPDCEIPHLLAMWQGMTNFVADGVYSNDPASVDRVRAELNAVLLALPPALLLQQQAQQVEQTVTYNRVHRCASRVQAELEQLQTAKEYNAQARANASGLYFFYEYEAHELPVLWWLKYQQYSLFYPEARAVLAAASADPGGRIPVPSFDARLTVRELREEMDEARLGSQSTLTLRDVWARSPLRVDLTSANVEEYIATFVGYSVQSLLREQQKVQFEFACPYDLKFEEYAKGADRTEQFENIADGYWVKDEASDALARRIVDDVHKDPRGVVQEYETGALAEILRPASSVPGGFESWAGEGAGSVVQDMVVKDFKAADVEVLSPFDPNHRDDLLATYNVRDNEHVVPIARFTLPDTFKLSDNTVLEAVGNYEEESGCSNEELVFEPRNALLGPESDGTHCIYGPSTLARLRESTAMGQFVDGEPAVELVRNDQKVFTRYLCEHDDDVRPDYMHPPGFGGQSSYPQCSFRQPEHTGTGWPGAYRQMSEKFDGAQDTVMMSADGGVPDGFCEYDEYGHEPYVADRPRVSTDLRSAARAYMPANAPMKPYTDRCFRLDSACVTQRDGLQEFFTGLDAGGDVYDDVFERIEHNAFTQMNTNGVRYLETPKHLEGANTWTAYRQMYDDWTTTSEAEFMNMNRARQSLTRRPSHFFEHKRHSRVYDVRWPDGPVPPSGIEKQVYLLNVKAFNTHQNAYAYLTSKDRVLFERSRTHKNTRTQLLFGHEKHSDGGRILAAPTFSFCPADPNFETNVFDDTDIHYFREVNTEQHRRVTTPAFGVRAGATYAEIETTTWQKLADLLFRRISFLPIVAGETHSLLALNSVEQTCRDYHNTHTQSLLHEKAKTQAKFMLRADPREHIQEYVDGDVDGRPWTPSCQSSQPFPYEWPFTVFGSQYMPGVEAGSGWCFPNQKAPPTKIDVVKDGNSASLRKTIPVSSNSCETARTAPITMTFDKLYYDEDHTDEAKDEKKPFFLHVDDTRDLPFEGTRLEHGFWKGKTIEEASNDLVKKIFRARDDFKKPVGIWSRDLRYLFKQLFVPQYEAYAIKRNTMLDVYNVFKPDDASDHAASTNRPCQMPRAGEAVKLTDLAACYEQDVYEPVNGRPWWSVTACDMLRGFLDGMSSYESLRYWLDFKLPQSLTLGFLSQFSPYDLSAFFENDPERGYEIGTLRTFLTNHIAARDETLLLHHYIDKLFDVPRAENLLHTLLGMHLRDERTVTLENKRKLFLTPCLKTYRENSQNLHVIQSLDVGGALQARGRRVAGLHHQAHTVVRDGWACRGAPGAVHARRHIAKPRLPTPDNKA
jgi:hypothetical protein